MRWNVKIKFISRLSKGDRKKENEGEKRGSNISPNKPLEEAFMDKLKDANNNNDTTFVVGL